MREEKTNLKTESYFGLSSRQFIKDFSLFIKRCYHIV